MVHKLSLMFLLLTACQFAQANGDFDPVVAHALAMAREKPDDAEAQFTLGVAYATGKGVSLSDKQAFEWFSKAAAQGHAQAQYHLGLLYYEGQGIQQDSAQALNWYNKSAAQGYANAQFNLGDMYYFGKGVAQDGKQAMTWFAKAADQGFADAQHSLGVMYAEGQSVKQDYVQAYVWFSVSAANDQASALEDRDFVATKLTPAMLENAQAEAAALMKKTLLKQKNEK